MQGFTHRRHAMWGGLVAIVAAVLCLGLVATAPAAKPPKDDKPAKAGKPDHAGKPDCTGRGVPVSKISIQEFTFAEYIGFGTDAATQARLEEVLAFLSETGYRNIELFTLSGLTAEQMRDLLDEYGLKARSRHVGVGTPASPVDLGPILEENRTLGIKFFGSGATPNFATEAEWVAYAEYLNELGEQARKAGQRLMVHNHNWEFERTFGDTSAYEILLANTERKNVVFQVDLYWAVRGLGVANGATSIDAAEDLAADLLAQLGKRVRLFHVKDMATGTFPGRIEIVGEGGIDFPALFDATQGPVRYYVVEHDPRFGDATFDPFEAAATGFEYLRCVRF
jgi:sugar phosphate isomerase/epimerase